jgi:sarcosine oxidase subunit delta
MKIMHCPLNGPRNITEFICAGELKSSAPANADAREQARSIYLERNRAGVVCEWWMHVPSAYWFIAERDTRSDEIVRTLSFEAFMAEQQVTSPEQAPS